MSTSVHGNSQFTSVEDTTHHPSKLGHALDKHDPLSGVKPFTAPLVANGVAAGVLTAAQLQEAASGGPLGLGLLLDGSGGTYSLIAAADTAANAKAIQTALGLSALNDAKLLRFYFIDAPAADAVLPAAGGSSVIVTSLAAADNRIFEATASTGGGTAQFQALVLVSATNVTASSETVTCNILQAGGIAT
jgi:hypothetical protein